jgi:hypothetical protein
MPAGDNNSPLITALAALVELDPERGGMVLRKAIASLVADDSRSPGRISHKDVEGWARIRTRLRQAMADDKLTARRLGEQLELSESSIDKATSPSGRPPSNDIIARVQQWLTSRDAENTRPPAAVNGHVVERRSHAGRLSEVERERLAAHVQFTAERELRQALGLTSLIITQAISGAELPAEAIERIANFLAAQGNGAR